ncbi:hypothetical protein XA68_17214 [Ophiocordyceps unilateralis]|uniref:Myb-like domain-containing protein n=1 Tax=Ophiocordyceps unilateralis TaxID=268505 RepID=A0A2A9PJD6_OPHUN|nr:hypothetical protein XA68_17214 [Ophiocordyceps unilateralis]
MMLPDSPYGLCLDDDDTLNRHLLTCYQRCCALDQSFYDISPAEVSADSQASGLKTPLLPHPELFSHFDFIECFGSPEPVDEAILNNEIHSVLTPQMVDLNLNSGHEWTLPFRERIQANHAAEALALSYEAAEELHSWDEAKYVPQGLEMPEAAVAAPDALQLMSCGITETPCEVDLDTEIQTFESQQERDEYWLGPLSDFPEIMFQPMPLTPSAASSTLAGPSLCMESLEDDPNSPNSPATTIYTEMSDFADDAVSASSPNENNVGSEEDGRKKLPSDAPKAFQSAEEPSSPLTSSQRNAKKLAARRKRRRRATPPSPEPMSPKDVRGPPYKKIDQMDSVSRQLLDRILIGDREPPVGKPVPYSIIMDKLSHLFCGAEETLRGHYRRLTKPKEQRVRKPVWQDNDVRLLEEAVRLCQANTKRKISWTAVREYIVSHGGSYKFGVTACSKKWYAQPQ